ncbi:hypothetical protein ABT117_37445, partial [Streptomyces sp. NPDC002262]
MEAARPVRAPGAEEGSPRGFVLARRPRTAWTRRAFIRLRQERSWSRELELGHPGLASVLETFCERWEWGVRGLTLRGN